MGNLALSENQSLKKYQKPALSYREQVDLMLRRGLNIADEERARQFLSYANYYRFSGYAFIFQDKTDGDLFFDGVSFEQIRALYDFDRALRLLVAEGVSTIEIYARTQIVHYIATKYGPFGHLQASTFQNVNKPFLNEYEWRDWLEKARNSVRYDGVCTAPSQHFKKTYRGWPDLPIWLLVEILTFGSLNVLFSLLLPADQKKIARQFNLNKGSTLSSWLRVLCIVRNICAHYGRLWNRNLRTVPEFPQDQRWNALRSKAGKPFAFLTIINYLLACVGEKTSVESSWNARFAELWATRPMLAQNNDAFFCEQTGFPVDWADLELWKN